MTIAAEGDLAPSATYIVALKMCYSAVISAW